MPTGIVLWFNTEKGYGFLKAADGSEIFVQENAIVSTGLRTLIEGQKVSFTVTQGQKGPQAENIQAI